MTTIVREKDSATVTASGNRFVMVSETGYWTSSVGTNNSVYDANTGRTFIQSKGLDVKTGAILLVMPDNSKTQKQNLIKFFDDAGWITVTDTDFFPAPARFFVTNVETSLWTGTDTLRVEGTFDVAKIGGATTTVLATHNFTGGSVNLAGASWTNSTENVGEIVIDVTFGSTVSVSHGVAVNLSTNRGALNTKVGSFAPNGSTQPKALKRLLLSSLGGYSAGEGFIVPAGSKTFSIAPNQAVTVDPTVISFGSGSGVARLIAKSVA